MPTTGYDGDAMGIGSLRSGTRPRWFKLMVLAIFVAATAVGAGAAPLFR
jgi:hypothetical protein